MRALASDREITATLGVPVRRVELAAWLGSGIVCGAAGLLLADLFTSLDYTALTFLVISSLAAALIGRLRSLWVTLAGGLAVGLAAGRRHAVRVDLGLPDGRAVRARDRRAALSRPPPHGHALADGRVAACSISDAQPRATMARGIVGRSAVIVAFLGVALFVAAGRARRGLDQDPDGVAIYAVVAAGLVTLYGRVGMISLGQIALLAIGTWTATRISYAADLPFPILLLVTGAITCVVGVLIGLPALRLSGLYLALITLMAAGAVNVVLTTINFPNGGHGFTGRTSTPDLSGLAARRPARHRGGRHGLLPLHDRRLRAHVPADRRALRHRSPGAPGPRSARASRRRSRRA